MNSIISTSSHASPLSWQKQLSNIVTDAQQLIDYLQLPQSYYDDIHQALQQFPLKVPEAFLARIKKGCLDDPLLRQILPLAVELEQHPEFSLDPLLELDANPVSGIIHKYPGRVLLIPTSACAIHCRYCFRRHFPYGDNTPTRSQWNQSLDYIRSDTSIEEIILSGGDPLACSDRQLSWLNEQLSSIQHVKRLRIHSRLPLVLPDRIDANFLHWSRNSRLQVIVVVHCNHAQEIDNSVGEAVEKMRRAGIMMFNQTVLLRGINDNLATLASLSKKLIEVGVAPYYLHLLDKVQGAQHFDLPVQQAITLHRQLRDSLPGYMVPQLVQERAGELSKTLLR